MLFFVNGSDNGLGPRHHGLLCGHYWDYNPGTLSLCEVAAFHLKIKHQQNSSSGAQSSNELQIET